MFTSDPSWMRLRGFWCGICNGMKSYSLCCWNRKLSIRRDCTWRSSWGSGIRMDPAPLSTCEVHGAFSPAGHSDSTSVRLGHYSIWEAVMRQIFQLIFLCFAQNSSQGRCWENGHGCQNLPHKPELPQTPPLVKANEQSPDKICLAAQFFKIL